MRHYQPIWKQLKKDKYCRIAAPSNLHKRIIKAVIKEKYIDTVYKFELGEQQQTAKVTYKKTAQVIEFFLTIYTKGCPEI